MRKYIFLVSLALVALMSGCSSCSSKKEKPGSVEDVVESNEQIPQMTTGRADTAAVMNLTNDFISMLKNNDVDGALHNIYYLVGDTIKPLPNDLKLRERAALGAVAGAFKYDIEELAFFKEKDCKVKVNVTLFDKKPGDPAPNTMGIILKPVRRNGHWYMTLADSEYDTNHGTEIKN